jgi:C-terminal processing protease CtpA/Prc
MTIAEWKTANSHKSIHKTGITPDYLAPVAITSSDPNFDALVQLARNN